MRYFRSLLLCTSLLVYHFAATGQPTGHAASLHTKGMQPYSIRQLDSLSMLRQRTTMNPHYSNQYVEHRALPTGKIEKGRVMLPPAAGRSRGSFFSAGGGGNQELICSVISGRDFLKQDSVILAMGDPTMLPDGNIILSGEFADYSLLPNINSGAFCMKTTTEGQIIWGLLLDSSDVRWDFMNLPHSKLLANGDILLAGRTSNPVYGSNDFVLARLDGNGNLRWLKTYQSRYWQGFNGSGDYWRMMDLDEDPATGDIYVTGSHWFGKTTVLKVTGTDGAITWSRAYKKWNTDSPFGLEVEVNNLVMFTLEYDNNNNQYINVLSLSKSTGDTIYTKTIREIRSAYADPGVYNPYRSRRTSNGHYLLSGPTTRYFEFPVHTGTVDLYHAATVELDEQYNFVKAYGFKNRVESNGYNTRLSNFADGRGMFTMMKYISGFTAENLMSLVQYDTIYHSRRRFHFNEGMPYEPMSLQLPDGGILNVKWMSDSTLPMSAGARLDYYRAHISDTASACMGLKDSATTTWYRAFEPSSYNFYDSVTSNVFFASMPKTYSVYPFAAWKDPGCVITSNCDTLDISLSSPVVCLGSSAVLHIQRNVGCGSLVPIGYDTSAIRQLGMVNDSSYLLQFNAVGSWYITGSVQGCQLIRDSVLVTVLPAPGPVQLGADTSLCTGNSIVLHAGNLYASYQWQNGSSDSVFTVMAPGTYHVRVTDACGNTYNDTIAVNTAAFAFSVGPDRVKCNADSILLTATAGFNNYQWGNNYQMGNSTGAQVLVYPLIDTFYYATAEKWPGCTVRDTVRVTVNHSPPIQLGADTSLCAGASIILNAGAGFTSYAWNTGATTATIVANEPGPYQVTATANGCTSSDTFRLLPAKDLPRFSLGSDTSLCTGQYLRVQFNLPQASYEWQDGTNSNAYTISQAGLYILKVTQQGCSSIDSIDVAYKPSPLVQLGNDSLLCEGESIVLDAGNAGASYLWQDGALSRQTIHRQSGFYHVVVNLDGCTASDSIRLRFDALPAFNLGADKSLCIGESFMLGASANPNMTYLWQDGATTASINVNRPGIYVLTGSNQCGAYTDSIKVSEGLCKLIMPGAFTPNNDGINDLFRVKYPYPVKQFSFIVYNRYGQPVFETSDMLKGWDGRFRSSPQETGAYTWVIRLMNNDNTVELQSGAVILIR